MAPQIQESQSSPWSSLLTARQSFSSPSSPSRDSGLHPAAIFGIVAGVMFLIIIVAWIFWFTLIKKALTHRDYGILPSIRNASNGRRHGHGHSGSTSYPYYGPGPGGDSLYGGNNMSQSGGGYGYGDSATRYPPAAHHHRDPSPPAYDWSRRPEYSSTATATAGHKNDIDNRAHEPHNSGISSGGPSAGHN